jgi:hypothetical protein
MRCVHPHHLSPHTLLVRYEELLVAYEELLIAYEVRPPASLKPSYTSSSV